MESSLWSSISSPHQQISDHVLQDYFSTENNYIYTQIFYFRAPSTLKKGTDGEHEQHLPWALLSYLWYRYRNNIWGKHCRMCPLGCGTEPLAVQVKGSWGLPGDRACSWAVPCVCSQQQGSLCNSAQGCSAKQQSLGFLELVQTSRYP